MFPKRPTDPNYVDTLKMTKEEAINESIGIIASDYVTWIDGWFDMSMKHKDLIYFCEFENLRADPKKEFMKILEFYEIKLPINKFDKINEASKGKSNMGDNLNKAPFLPWAVSSNFRTGIVGGWKNHFTGENKKYFKRMVGNGLVRYGYENDDNWVYGCIYDTATNYNAEATFDDGSCDFMWGDVNHDGSLGIQDIIIIINSILSGDWF